MKTLTILFESPNVFYAVIDGMNIRIDNHEILPISNINGRWFDIVEEHYIAPGNKFQVEGFEYHLIKDTCTTNGNCDCKPFTCNNLGDLAILNLAKEDEQEPDIQTSDIHHTFKPHGQFKVKEEEPKCRCSNDLEYSNCSINCERHFAEVEQESFFIKAYNQAIDDVLKLAFERTSEHKPSISLLMIKEIEKLKK